MVDVTLLFCLVGCYQLRELKADDLIHELLNILQRKEYDYEENIVASSLPSQWLEKVWSFLAYKLPNHLSRFEGYYFLPLKNNERLCVLSTKVPIMVHSSFTSDVVEMLKDLGITVLSSIPHYVQSHPEIKNYLVSSGKITEILVRANNYWQTKGNSLAEKVENLDVESTRVLRKLLANQATHDLTNARDFLRMLPLFETVKGSGRQSSHFVCFKSKAGPDEKFLVNFPDVMIDANSGDSQKLHSALGGSKISFIDMLVHLMQASYKYSSEDIKEIAKTALMKFHQYRNCNTFVQELKSLQFMYKAGYYGLVAAHDLVQPKQSLQELMTEIGVVPTGEFCESRYAAALKEIGLRSEPSDSELENAAQHIESLSASQGEKAARFGEALLSYLQTKGMYNPLLKSLSHIAWMPVVRSRTTDYPSSLEWLGFSSFTVSPQQAIPVKHASLCASTRVIVRDSTLPDSHLPTVSDVVKHLRNCVQAETEREAHLATTVIKIYSHLHSNHTIYDVKESLKQEALTTWIWKGNGFVSEEDIVSEKPLIAVEPHMYTLPHEIYKVKRLFLDCGMKENCNFVELLQRIKKLHDENCNISQEERKRDLEMSVSILNHLSHSKDFQKEDLLLPVHNANEGRLVLMPLEECVYCDEERLEKVMEIGEDDDDEEMPIRIVRKEIANSTSQKLGVANLMSRILYAEDLDISFGQSESLLDRLNSILKD